MSNSLEKLMPKIEKSPKGIHGQSSVSYMTDDEFSLLISYRNYCLAALEGKVGVLSDVKVEDVQDIIIDSYLDKLARFSGTFSHDPRDPYNTPERALAQAILDMLKKKTEK